MEEPLRSKLSTWWCSLTEKERLDMISAYHELLAPDQQLFMEDIEIMYNETFKTKNMTFRTHTLNEQRVRKYFAILPIRIGSEIKWLETVEYVQEWYAPDHCWGWYKIKFINEFNKKYYENYKRYGSFKSNWL